MIGLADYRRNEFRRWALSAAIALAAHIGIFAGGMAHWRTEAGDPGELGAAMVIDFEMLNDPSETPDVAPGPEQVQAENEPEKPVEKTEEKVEEKIARVEESDIPLPEPPKPEPPRPTDTEPPAPATTAPQISKGEKVTIPPSWTRQVVGLLEKNKRYPSTARARNEHGIVQLAFSLDRAGHVTASRIVKSSGSAVLDSESLELVKRAEPFPPLPPNVGDTLDLTVPIRFNIR